MNGTAYISGPITAKPKTHKADFKRAREHLLYYGFFPIDPHDVSPYASWKTFRDYMNADIHILTDEADYIYLLPGWWHSKGAWLELIVAMFCGIPILNGKVPRDRS